jgi:3-hydroxyisobutyrate dehydrogenase-like beta-hydroxyacid dehydrogenase
MGAAVGGALSGAGLDVAWASSGRSDSTAGRAGRHGLDDAGDLGALLSRSMIVIVLCPPHAAVEVAEQVASHEYRGVYVDANAIAPRTADEVARVIEVGGARYVDGAIVGTPPGPGASPRFYVSGDGAAAVASIFRGTAVDARPLSGEANAASALKVAYAAWTKGSAALMLAAEESARRAGVESELEAEWSSLEGLTPRLERAHRDAASHGWRWAGEMEEVARAFADLDLPPGFHRSAAEVYARLDTYADSSDGDGDDGGRRWRNT